LEEKEIKTDIAELIFELLMTDEVQMMLKIVY